MEQIMAAPIEDWIFLGLYLLVYLGGMFAMIWWSNKDNKKLNENENINNNRNSIPDGVR